jgi:hypothetical protein
MKSFLYIIFLSIIVAGSISGSDWPVLKGPYLGQKPPGMTPEIFAPDLISTSKWYEAGSSFNYQGNIFAFNRFEYKGDDKTVLKIYITQLRDGKWTRPRKAPFNGEYNNWDLTFSPNSNVLYFTTTRPTGLNPQNNNHSNIWKIAKTANGWAEPILLSINTPGSADSQYASVSNSGTIYFFSPRKGGYGRADLYYAFFNGGEYKKAQNIGDVINTEYSEFDSYIAPDEKYLIYTSGKPGSYGILDLWLTIKKKDGSWGKPVNLGNEINIKGAYQTCPFVTADGKYLFFTRHTVSEKKCDIYWVSIHVLDELKAQDRQ